MPSKSRGFRLLENTAGGYLTAVRHLGRLLPVLLPVTAFGLLGSAVLDLALGHGQLALVDGHPTPYGPSGPLGWLKLALAVVCWLLGLTAATATLVGAERGAPVDPRRALAAAARVLPVLIVGLGAAAVLSYLGVLALINAIGPLESGLPIVVFAAAVTALALVATRPVFGVATWVLGGRAWEPTRGWVWSSSGAFLLGGVAAPLFGAHLEGQMTARVLAPSAVQDLVEALLSAVVMALQAGLIATVYLGSRDEDGDLAALDARLAALAGRRPRWAFYGAAAAVLAVLAPGWVAAANPYRAPVFSVAESPVGIQAVAWPAGGHPVILTNHGVRYCDTDRCDRHTGVDLEPTVMNGWGIGAVGVDGAVVSAVVTGGPDKGGPFIEYGRCTRAGCRRGWLPVRASAKEPAGDPEIAVGSAPDGAIWFAVAMPSLDDRPGKSVYTITMIRCAQAPCAKPERHLIGTTERTPEDGYVGSRGRMAIGADGRPVASFWIGNSVYTVTCEAVTCARPQTGSTDAPVADALWTAPATLGDQVFGLKQGSLALPSRWVPLRGSAAQPAGAITVAGSRVYAVTAELTTDPRSGFRIRYGPTPPFWQQILWRCPIAACDRPERVPLDVFSGLPEQPEAIAVSPDGRVLIAREDRVILLESPI